MKKVPSVTAELQDNKSQCFFLHSSIDQQASDSSFLCGSAHDHTDDKTVWCFSSTTCSKWLLLNNDRTSGVSWTSVWSKLTAKLNESHVRTQIKNTAYETPDSLKWCGWGNQPFFLRSPGQFNGKNKCIMYGLPMTSGSANSSGFQVYLDFSTPPHNFPSGYYIKKQHLTIILTVSSSTAMLSKVANLLHNLRHWSMCLLQCQWN